MSKDKDTPEVFPCAEDVERQLAAALEEVKLLRRLLKLAKEQEELVVAFKAREKPF